MPKHSNSIYQRTKSFLKKAKIVHNDKYDYSLVEYINVRTKITIICPCHGKFQQLPQSHVSGNGCKECQNERITFTTKEFIKRCGATHGNKYDYSQTDYLNAHAKVCIICPIHGEFYQKADDHMKGYGCNISPCRTTDYTIKDFIKASVKKHNNRYDYSKVEYVNTKTKTTIVCHRHGDFLQIPNDHLNGAGCPKCSNNYSTISIKWLNKIAIDNNIFIQHALNVGEYNIPNTRFRVDGFCEETNTIYEFHGDVFHGNLNKYLPNETCHPYDKKITAKELYETTMERENKLKFLGYNLVTIWESDFKSQI